MSRQRVVGAFGIAMALIVAAAPAAGAQRFRRPPADAACDAGIPAITAGYGANGPYAMDEESTPNPAMRQPVEVFFPRGAAGRVPVIFFSHGFGPGVWQAYRDLITHLVSRGYAVVYSSYPVLNATMDERYGDLWAGFAAAASHFAGRLDLTRVGFVGHSFGGGATPAMAAHGVLEHGWGSAGAFAAELAPWYSYQITNERLAALAARVTTLVEVYDRDVTNDPRMAIDLYAHAASGTRYFFSVASADVQGCQLTADHSTPGRNPSLVQKQYGVFRPLDALADAVFDHSAAARDSLGRMGRPAPAGAYQPLREETDPAPADAGRRYQWPWINSRNPRVNH